MTDKESVGAGPDGDGYRRLEGAQAEIRDAFFAAESGLFVLDCGPGAGKSVTADSVAAEDLARKARAGVDSPTETLCLTSFSRDDAASILPGVERALRGFAEDPEAPVGLDDETASELGSVLRGSDRVGTIDSVLGAVFEAVAGEVGFDEVPEVGDSAALAQVHGDALDAVRSDASLSAALATLDDGYPGGRYDADTAGLLAAARSACRERRLSVPDLRERLEAAVSGTYPDGPPASLEAVLRDTERFFGAEERAAVERELDADPAGDAGTVVDADADCHDRWFEAVDALCTVLPAYLDAYDEACRASGVLAHVDVAHWIATFFESGGYESPFRERLRERWTGRLSTVIVDEAQDVSRAQHDALAPLVDADTRVLLVGDREQCIYAWRNAQPSLFDAAAADGRYFGIDWETHERRSATRTYRPRPAIAAAIDTVFEPVFTDPTRGAADAAADEREIGPYEPLSAVRGSTAEPSVHVAAFPEHGRPGSPTWVDPEEGLGEAEALADCIATGLASDRFEREDGEDPGVTVLFHRRTHMDAYVDAFADAGLSVRDTSRALFDHPLVGAVCAVVDWLRAPTTQEATLRLVNDDDLPVTGLVDKLMRADWSITAVADAGSMRGGNAAVVDGLADLARRRADHLAAAGADVVSDVIETLSLAADPLDQSATAADHAAVLDRLVGVVADWEGDRTFSLAELAAALDHARRNPKSGPSLPTAAEADVTFRTIHGAKGDEDDVVAVADLGTGLGRYGAYLDQFVAHGRHVALAPPEIDLGDDYPDLGGTVLADGPYDPDASPGDGDAGLRWASEQWVEADPSRLAGAPPLRSPVAAARAERWRLLYVALSRARDHLVLPLPGRRSAPTPRDRWVDTLRDALAFDAERPDEYTVATPGEHDPLTVAVHRAAGGTPEPTGAAASEPATVDGPDPLADRGWTPRFVNPSTVYELSAAPEAGVLAHLSGQALHAEQDGVTVPLSFETMGPEVVGDVAHDVFAAALSAGVDAGTLRNCEGPVPAALDRAVREHARGVASDEREQLRRYVEGTLCPQLAETEVYERLVASRQRYVEEPLDAVVRVAGLAVEVGGRADVVSVDRDGQWHVDELKIGLRPPEPDLRDRYELQAATYAWLLERQEGTSVTATVTTVGAHRETTVVTAGEAAVRDRLDRLADRRWNCQQ
ncbi:MULTISPECIES: UvrD-helicase domain-containing protein [Halolamina]|uniref:DNA 3'-5' helicase n=1 Tax=Halolamina pelagica TaxID=699431 RepID=A0A1I5NS94_9EURY|nr:MULTISPECIES: UvrD-helicase domain-containing protein [Halolamina]NHX36453.1 UvrD-helicase domain-containing protein [Halolamina sp. R1-12]SFP24654.1 ATP-dependent helicase/nuclease subunit A [Halolamina pelagica]